MPLDFKSNWTLHIYCKFLITVITTSCYKHSLCEYGGKSPEDWKLEAACQVHVWHVSEGYTIISSSSLSEFIVLNFCPSLNIRWKHRTRLQLVNGCSSQGICLCFCAFRLQIAPICFRVWHQNTSSNLLEKRENGIGGIKVSFMNIIRASLTRRDRSETSQTGVFVYLLVLKVFAGD